MKNSSIKPQSDVESDMDVGLEVGGGVSGIETVGSELAVEATKKLEGMGEDGEKEGEFRKANKRTGKDEIVRYDKQHRPLISKGFWVRKDLHRKYEIKAAILGENKQDLYNDALEYYYENVLNKSQSERLKEAGVGELGI